jgi:hypothetical protein
MSDQLGMSTNDEVPIEVMLRELHSVDKNIADSIRQRGEIRKAISGRMNHVNETIYASDDWFEGSVKGGPVPERDTVKAAEVPYETGPYDEPSKARRY